MSDLLPMVLLGLLTIAAAPVWPWSRGWGWAIAGILAMGLATYALFQFAVVPEGCATGSDEVRATGEVASAQLFAAFAAALRACFQARTSASESASVTSAIERCPSWP